MRELVMVICALNDMQQCETRTLPIYTMQCEYVAMLEVAKWSHDNEGWWIKKWECRRG